MTTTQDIRRAFEKRLKSGSFNGINTSQDIAWENVKFDPSGRDRWLRARLNIVEIIPATADNTSVERWTGQFYVDVFADTNNSAQTYDIVSDQIKELFPKGTQITENGKTINIRFSEKFSALRDDPWMMVPVSITFYAFISS